MKTLKLMTWKLKARKSSMPTLSMQTLWNALRKGAVLGLLFFVATLDAAAQSPDGLGRAPLASIAGGGIDSVNLFSGNVLLSVPFFERKGRELSTGVHLTYNAQGWEQVTDEWGTYGVYRGGWQTADPTGVTLSSITPYVVECDGVPGEGTYLWTSSWAVEIKVTDASGAVHYYDGPTQQVQYQEPNAGCAFNWEYYAPPVWAPSRSLADNSAVLLLDSEHFRLFQGSGPYFDSATGVESRNGNYAGYNSTTGLVEDTLGRTISFPSGIDWDEWHEVYDPFLEAASSIRVLDELTLPNGRSYRFEYDHDQGFVTKIHYPSGGFVAFGYINGNEAHDPAHNYVVSRTVSRDGSTSGPGVATWTYERSVAAGTRTITVTDPEGRQTVHLFEESTGLEYETRWKANSSSSPSKTVTISRETENGLPAVIVTKIGGLEQTETIGWWAAGVKSTSTISDWYPTGTSVVPMTRTTTSFMSYLTPQNDIVPTQTVLERWNGSAYAVEGKTEYFYDEYSLASVSGTVPQHHSPIYARRNLTTVRNYKDAGNYVEEHFHYDVLGNVVEHVDARGKSTTFGYADNFDGITGTTTYAFPTLVTNAEGHEASTEYSWSTGLPLGVTDARGLTTAFTYDSSDRVLTATDPNGRVTTTAYTEPDPEASSDPPTVTTVSDVASGVDRKVETTFDKLGRPVKVKSFDPDGDVIVETEYDALGRVFKTSNPYRSGTVYWTTTAFDELGRVASVTNPDSTSSSFAYTANTVTATDAEGISRRSVSDGLGRLTKVEEPNPTLSTPVETYYGYNGAGLLTGVTQGGQTRSFSYNWLGWLLSETHPEDGTTSYAYNSDGSVYQRTDARSKVATFGYDDIGRLLTVDYSDSTPDVTYAYDEADEFGFLTSVGVAGTTASGFEYDTSGNLTEENTTFSGISGTFTTGYTYDLEGRLLTVTYPNGRVVTRTFASGSAGGGTMANDRLSSLVNGPTSTSLLGTTASNAAGQVTAQTLGNGVAETRTFSAERLQLTRIAAVKSGTTLLDLNYGYGTTDNTGRIRSRTDAQQPEHSASYTFDTMGRLTSAGNSQWNISWALDRYGNRTGQAPSGLAYGQVGSPSIAYNGANQDTASGLSYDAAGNMTNDGDTTYTWDAENRLTQVGSSSVTYGYDAGGRRIRKTIGSDSTYYIYGLTGLLSEFSTDDTYSSATEAASTDRIAYRIGDPTGTAVLLADADGVMRENNRVFPFGEPWQPVAASANTEKFTSYQRDGESGESGLDYAMARYYASRAGRFMTPDPGHVGASLGDPQSWNAYVYVDNDPINFIDPSGTTVQCVGSECEHYLAGLKRLLPLEADLSFAPDGKVAVGGMLDRKRLTKPQAKLLGAIEHKKNILIRAVDVPCPAGGMFFGSSDGNGTHTINFRQALLLTDPDNIGGLTVDDLIGHETVEGLLEVSNYAGDAHAETTRYYPGFGSFFENPVGQRVVNGMITQVVSDMEVMGGGKNLKTERITRAIMPPVPLGEIQNARANGARFVSCPTKVERTPRPQR